MSTPRVLVTGATGFLGRHLLGALRARNVPAAVLVRRPDEWVRQDWVSEAGPVHVVEGGPLAPDAWMRDPALADVKTVFHLAAQVKHSRVAPEEMETLNVEGTLHMVRVASALGARLVYVSSSGTVGCFRFPDVVADEHAPHAEALAGRWPYYASKIRAEKEARRLADKLGVELVIVRPPVLLGPGDHRFRSTGHVLRVLEHRLPVVPRGGMHFTDVRDVAASLTRLTELEQPRSIYHLPGTASTLGAFFRMVSEVSYTSVTERQVPNWLLEGVARVARSSSPRWLPDPVVLEMSTCYWGLSSLWSERELGHTVRPPRQTLVETVSWLREHAPRKAAHR
ncbi:NAD-dependent epimerase/dehydratase family protein [Myxococcus hansupus]|uniref:NAD-dependent epimerase/dehydratase family protein n=1 Tax=Pseudomyxococcus hansupus TaxID=1297742 RepID=UPI0005D0F892|nr:NAD-dependent epimerase/dehydratase family protein [Myxococcus hansupus]